MIITLVVNIIRKGWVYQILVKKVPGLEEIIYEAQQHVISTKKLFHVVLLSLVIEVIGILHLYISIKALGGQPTLEIRNNFV